MSKWSNDFQWIKYVEKEDKVFCSVCTQVYNEYKIKRLNSGNCDELSYNAFVKKGFSNWKKALERFKMHENCNMHRQAVQSLLSAVSEINVFSMVNSQSAQAKKDARHCLIKIFETVRFLGIQCLPIRGHSESNSNFVQLLHLRSTDCPILKAWLDRPKYKWISHEILSEILSLMSYHVQKKLQNQLSIVPFYAIMADETADVSKKEQMSINIRIVDDKLVTHEKFLGFYECSYTTADILFATIKDALQRYNLSLSKCRGQCYDGASNVSGEITGLQTRIREVECRALFTHCAGHNLNLSSQDTMSKIPEIADLLSVMKSLVTFIRASPKRVNVFKDIQCQFDEVDDEDDYDDEEKGPKEMTSLKPFCPTRWCVRVKSLKSIRKNYKFIIDFCDKVGSENVDPEAGVKARGFSTYLNKFETYLMLEIAIAALEKVEELNETIQAKTINFKSVIRRVDLLKTSLQAMRTAQKFDSMWNATEDAVKISDLENKCPAVLRNRKMPKRFDENATAYVPPTPKDKFRPIYFSVID